MHIVRWLLVFLLVSVGLLSNTKTITQQNQSEGIVESEMPTPPHPASTASTPTPQHKVLPPTPTAEPMALTATVWDRMPQVPILMYHRFNPQPNAVSEKYKTSLSDFSKHLADLYEAGYSLISLEDWLQGEIHLQEGRRPLILTIDDLFYADQISLDEHGQPAEYSGIGRLWSFSQSHPDFNFHVALFYNLGDKPYSNHYENGSFTVQDGWRQDRAQSIAWGIENGAIPLNHFYDHPRLDQLTPEQIEDQLLENDRALREALALIGKEALAAGLPNILALPYVVWPETEAGKQILFDYISQEGAPVSAILEANDPPRIKLFSAPFSPEYDPWHVPRLNAEQEAIDLITEMRADIPQAIQCDLGVIYGSPEMQTAQIMNLISEQTDAGRCPLGIYIVTNLAFEIDQEGIRQLSP